MPWAEFMVAAVGGGQGLGSLRKFPQESLVGWLCLLFWILNYSVFVFLIYKKYCPWGLPWVFQTGVRNSVKIWPVRFRRAQDLRWNVLAKEGGYFPGLLFHWKIQTPRLEWAFFGSLLSHCPLLDPYAESHPLPGDPMVGGCGRNVLWRKTNKQKRQKPVSRQHQGPPCWKHEQHIPPSPKPSLEALSFSRPQSTLKDHLTLHGQPHTVVICPSFPDGWLPDAPI